MMLICAWPSAGPTGGAGVALPASICNLTDVCTFFGAICSLFFENLYRFCGTGTPACARKSLRCHFLYLPELQLNWRRAAKDRHHHFQRLAIFVHFVHRAVEIRERPI